MKKYNLKYLFIATLSVFILGCKYTEEPAIPSSERYVTASPNFELVSQSVNDITNDSIDFTLDTVRFSAEFNEEVSWTIFITSLTNTVDFAEKIIQGTSSSINPNEVFWTGDSDNLYFFKKDEDLEIKLVILGRESDEILLSDNLSILKTKKFNNVTVLDFESVDSKALISDPGSVFMFFDTENLDEYLDSAKFIGTEYLTTKGENIPTPVEGNGLIYMRGIDIVGQPNSFFIGGFNHSPKLYGLDAPLDSIYINMYVSSFGNTTTKMIIEFDGLGGDTFRSEKFITWDGWNLVSVKLSDFVLGNAGALGTGILAPEYLKKFAIQIHSGDGAAKEAEILVDYVNFTYGSPFKQSN